MKSLKTLLVLAVAAVASFASAAATVAKTVGYSVAETAHDAVTGFMAGAGFLLFATTRAAAHTGVLPIRVAPTCQEVQDVPIPFEFPAANVAVNDILALVKVPAGVEIVDWSVLCEDADSNGVPTIAFTLGSLNAGLTDIATTYKAGITVAQSGGVQRNDSAACFTESSAAERSVGIKWTAAAATYVAGKKGLLILSTRG